MKKHVFIIGSRGLPAKYGGFETFVEELVKHQNNKNIKYHLIRDGIFYNRQNEMSKKKRSDQVD